MIVAVMPVGPVSVRVFGFRMLMFVGMGHVRHSRVAMTMMKIAVDMGMRMLEPRMLMGMIVLFSGHQNDAQGH